MMKSFIFICLLTTCVITQAQVYSYVDQNGNTIYTDTVPEQQKDSARKLEIELTPSTPKPPITASNIVATDSNVEPTEIENQTEDGIKTLKLSPDTPFLETTNNSVIPSDIATNQPKTQYVESYQSLKIESPKQEETFANTSGQITIKVTSNPKLANRSLYRFIIDNNVVSETTAKTLDIGSLERGEHRLMVQIISDSNDVLMTSEQVVFFIRQTTLADKRRVRPCLIREYGIRPECPIEEKPKPQPRNLLLRVTDAAGITAPSTAE